MRPLIAATVVLLMGIAGLVSEGRPETFVIPHALELSGTTGTTNSTWDTYLNVFYTTSIGPVGAGPGAKVDLYLYEDSGAFLQSAISTNVCDPCSFIMNAGNRKEEILFDTLILNAGNGSYPNGLGSHWAIVEVSSDADAVSLETITANSAGSVTDIRTTAGHLLEVFKAGGTSAPTAWVLPHALDVQGSVLLANTYDTQIYFTYSSGRGTVPAGSGASVDVYLYDQETEDLLRNDNTDPVCAPCIVSLDSNTPKVESDLEEWIRDANNGNYTAAGFHKISAVMFVGGDADGVRIGAKTIQSRSGPADLLVMPLHVEPIDVSIPTSAAQGFPIGVSLHAYPNPTLGSTTIRFNAPRPGGGRLDVLDVRGRRIVTLVSGEIAAGPQIVTWDGRDARGVKVGTGIYLARFQRGPWFRQAKIVVTR